MQRAGGKNKPQITSTNVVALILAGIQYQIRDSSPEEDAL
jgi:hypothetical protein